MLKAEDSRLMDPKKSLRQNRITSNSRIYIESKSFCLDIPHLESDAPALVNEGATCYVNSVLKMMFASDMVTLAIGRQKLFKPYTTATV